MIEALIAAKASVNIPTSTGATPLMAAATSGSVDAVRALLDHDAFVNARETANGQTALMFAAESGAPPEPIARACYDAIEQVRYEAIGATRYAGIRDNLNSAVAMRTATDPIDQAAPRPAWRFRRSTPLLEVVT